MRFLYFIIFFILISNIIWARVPIIENRSKVIARVKSVIIGDFPYVELVLEILKSESIGGFRNFAKEGDIILAFPLSLNPSLDLLLLPENRNLLLCYFLKPSDKVSCIIEFAGDERKRGWIIRSIERIIEDPEKNLEEVIKYFLLGKGFIKEKEDFSWEIEEKREKEWKVKVQTSKVRLRLILDSSLSILSFSSL
ncbi:MAG: hypothetical protein NZ841_03155 [Dictyoglomus sp.]|nr:hypothetical protein [Dictyoglomus sp.]MDW8188276.1 hypothetical protein [Dictyoglomus sp.]